MLGSFIPLSFCGEKETIAAVISSFYRKGVSRICGSSLVVGQKTHTHLIARPAPEAVGVELVDVEDVDGTLDAEVMQLAAHLQIQQVILRWAEREKDVRKRLPLLQAAVQAGMLTTVRCCSICPSTLPSLNWSLYCGSPMSSSQPEKQHSQWSS